LYLNLAFGLARAPEVDAEEFEAEGRCRWQRERGSDDPRPHSAPR
jgi:hypothetical protein